MDQLKAYVSFLFWVHGLSSDHLAPNVSLLSSTVFVSPFHIHYTILSSSWLCDFMCVDVSVCPSVLLIPSLIALSIWPGFLFFSVTNPLSLPLPLSFTHILSLPLSFTHTRSLLHLVSLFLSLSPQICVRNRFGL